MPTWEKLDEIDARLERPLQKSVTYDVQKMGGPCLCLLYFQRRTFNMLCVSLLWKCQECIQNDTIFSMWFNLGNELPSEGSVHHFVWLEHALGSSRQRIKIKIKCGLVNQHMVLWHSLTSTQRQAQGFISGPSPAAKSILLSFNRMQSRVVTCLLTGHNTWKDACT